MQKDYYTILGISRDGSPEDIQRAYRKSARKYHPDVSKEADAEERFKSINEAYSVLSDTEKRSLYDRYGENWQQAEQFEESGWPHGDGHYDDLQSDQSSQKSYFYRDNNYSESAGHQDFFKDLFSGGLNDQTQFYNSQASPQGRTIHADLSLTLDELINRGSKTISFKINTGNGYGQSQSQTKTIQVKIPPGVTDGSTIRLKGQGEVGAGNSPNGDLLLKINILPDKRFGISGHDLRSNVAITPWEAALGAKINVQTLATDVWLKIPPGTQNNRQFRLKGKGLPKKHGCGDLYVTVQIVIPDQLTEKEKSLFKNLSEQSNFNPRREMEKSDLSEAA